MSKLNQLFGWTKKSQLLAQLEKITEECGSLSAQCTKLENEGKILRRQRADLTAENRTLKLDRKKTQKLTSIIETLRRQRTDLTAENRTLKLNRKKSKQRLLLLGAQVDLVPAISKGASFNDSAVGYIKRSLGQKHRLTSRSFAHSLSRFKETRVLGYLCSAIHATSDRFYANAIRLYREAGESIVCEYALVEYVEALLNESPVEAELILKRIIDDEIPFEKKDIFYLAKNCIATKQFDVAKALMRKVDVSSLNLPEADQRSADWIVSEFERRAEYAKSNSGKTRAIPSIALLDYKMLDNNRASDNAGDYVQTIAMSSNLVRFKNIKFESDIEGLPEWMDDLRDSLNPDYIIDSAGQRVHLTLLDRDAASARQYTVPTWTIAFGWYMHPQFKGEFDFPFDKNVRPIFISFHVNNRAMLTQEVVDYLRQYQPIGCRDWSTVYVLREYGIKSFFSGCLTTTIGKVFESPNNSKNEPKRMALVDFIGSSKEFDSDELIEITQVGQEVKTSNMITNLSNARKLLNEYRSYDKIATSRLHCYLPCRSIGLDVVFRPKNDADVRFEGLAHLGDLEDQHKLTGLDGPSFNKIREGIESKLEVVLKSIIDGKSESEIYGTWNEICSKDVAAADDHCANLPPRPEIKFDLNDALEKVSSKRITSGNFSDNSGGRVDVAFAVDDNMSEILPIVLESLIAH
jgi:hypothetical protein